MRTEESSQVFRSLCYDMSQELIKRIRVYGIVQGVGFRPCVARHAAEAGIRGTVANKGPYVEIYAQGTERSLGVFLTLLRDNPPTRADIIEIRTEDVTEAVPSGGYPDFRIISSGKTTGEIFIPPDIAICDDCKKELFDPSNRRYLHPFINCTQCGPRLTIIDSLPYDRERTSMKRFPMCPACAREYHDPASRRFDAQPVCCHDCGPEVYLLPVRQDSHVSGHAAIHYTRKVIASGGIVAVKGIGGFHLCCDATNAQAVEKLRRRKHRPSKPFAVMMKNEQVAERECVMTPAQRKILTGHQKPILLLEKRKWGCSRLCAAVSPDNPTVGVMLPYAPIQLLLFDYDDGLSMPEILVMTSGNVSGAPIAKTEEEALSMLSSFCDCILSNNRPILLRCDDSVMDFYDDKPYMIRRSRGYAPLPVQCTLHPVCAEEKAASYERPISPDKRADFDKKPAFAGNRNVFSVLAIGGELKNTFCITRGDLFYPSSYIGDLGDARSVAACKEAVRRMLKLLGTRPQRIVCDLHPLYESTRLARELAEEYAVPLLQVQHHYAHILSCMAENNATGAVLGIALDGTGYGEDKTIWGGEMMICDPSGYQRIASVQPFLQVGGDAAAREGWRMAVSMIYGLCRKQAKRFACILADCPSDTIEKYKEGAASAHGATKLYKSMHKQQPSPAFDLAAKVISCLQLCQPAQARMLCTMQENRINAITSTSAGRLFDAAAAILGIRRTSTFEGEASTALMYHALAFEQVMRKDKRQASCCQQLMSEIRKVPMTRTDTGLLVLPTDQLIFVLIREKWKAVQGKKRGDISWRGREESEARETSRNPNGSAASTKQTDMLAYVFHASLADMLVRAAVEARNNGAPATCALSGGCFQNKLLLRLTAQGLQEEAFTVLRHHLIPPNDGGIALGQALAGSCQ